ncbi:MAG: hypothetical protein SFW36_08535 [Leptolyngbyaceae cyanobacterium bins.59]|nr:hypothetical protein [Leptolyngbyaceae cyanobacterium bins.59]
MKVLISSKFTIQQTIHQTVQQTELPQSTPANRSRRRADPHRVLAVETSAKLTVSVILSIVAIVTLAKIVPSLMTRQSELKELQSEVKSTNAKVTALRTSFGRYFDPQQARAIMQEQSHRVEATQRPIVWIKNGVPLNQTVPTKP